jgi:hypothetical protein
MVAVAFSVITGFASALQGNSLVFGDLTQADEFGLADLFRMAGVNNVLGSIVLMSLTVGSLIRRRDLPVGAITLVCALVPGVLGSSSGWDNWDVTLGFALGGVVTEVLIAVVGRRADARLGQIAIGAGLAAALSGGLIAMTAARFGLELAPELWTGTIVWSAVIGGGIALNADRHDVIVESQLSGHDQVDRAPAGAVERVDCHV